MLFTKASVIDAIKRQLPPSQRVLTDDIEVCLALALNEYSLHLQSIGTTEKYDESISSGAQEVTVDGDDTDLLNVWLLMLTMADGSKTIPDWKAPAQFLRDFDQVETATSQTPTHYTILEHSGGFPVIRFSHPLDQSATLTVWYHAEIAAADLSTQRFVTPIISLALAWLEGKKTHAGQQWYADYKQQRPSARAQDPFVSGGTIKLEKAKFDKDIDEVRLNINERRG